MVREEKITVSPAVSDTVFISSRESFASAASASPWLPVQMITSFSRGTAIVLSAMKGGMPSM
jgi:hypothetical protein